MGGINCHLPRPTRPVIQPTDLRNAGVEYAKILENVFNFSAHFSLANAKIESVMVHENQQKETALRDCVEALESFKKSMNFAQTALILLNKFIKGVSTLEKKPLDSSRALKLKNMSKILKASVENQQKLLLAYEESDINSHIKAGNLNRTIRDNSVTTYTECLAQNLADMMVELREYSVLDRNLESNVNTTQVSVI